MEETEKSLCGAGTRLGGVGADLRECLVCTFESTPPPRDPPLPGFSNHAWVPAPHRLSSSVFSTWTHRPRSSSDHLFSSPSAKSNLALSLSAFGRVLFM